MNKKGEVTYYSDSNVITLNTTVGLVPAVLFGSLAGLLIGCLSYEYFRYGVGCGVRTIIDAYKEGKLAELDVKRD